MSLFSSSVTGVAIAIVAAIIIKKFWTAIKQRARKKRKVHREQIAPSLSFFAKEPLPNSEEKGAYIKNVGLGRANNIIIEDFHHPKEKDWHFKFQKIAALDPGEEIKVDYDFLVGKQKAFNKYDLLWIFDPEHDHDFIAEIVINFSDIEGNTYNQIIKIGKGENQHENPRLIKP